jgi:hypothetical protein
MFVIDDVITYMRRILKTPSDASITDDLLIDYINRFYINDVDARIQLFDLKTIYQFQTQPGVDQYNMPLYDPQTETGDEVEVDDAVIKMYPVYQGFLDPCYVNGVSVPLNTLRNSFFNIYPDIVQNFQGVTQGNGGPTYTIQVPILPASSPQNPPFNAILRGHIDMSGVIHTGNNVDPPQGLSFPVIGVTNNIDIPVTSMLPRVWVTSIDAFGNNVVVTDSGFFLSTNVNYGLLTAPGKAPFGNQTLSANVYSTTQNTINYLTGEINVTFPVNIPAGNNINVQVLFFEGGLPRSLLYYNNTITLRSVPAQQYLVELTAYLTPAAFLNTAAALPFGYMGEYIARGAARKVLSDTGDIEQFEFYEPFFREQELLVWKRSQRQWTSTRTPSLYSQGFSQQSFQNLGGGTL